MSPPIVGRHPTPDTTETMMTKAVLAASLLLAAVGVHGFVRPSGSRFYDECGEYLVHGWNTYVDVPKRLILHTKHHTDGTHH